MLLAAWFAPMVLAVPWGAPHPMSVSSSRIGVEGARVHVVLRCQERTLSESLPLDSNGDQRLDGAEIARARDRIERYALDGYRLRDGTTGEMLAGRLLGVEPAHGRASDVLEPEPLLDLTLDFTAPIPLSAITVEFRLFDEADALHRDHAQLVWNGAEPVTHLLWVEDPTWSFDPQIEPPRGILGSYVTLGVEHILTGYDHLAFLLALLVSTRRLRSLCAVVSAFTLAHSLTLALAAFEVIVVPASIVEPAIAASIAWVAFHNLFVARPRSLWPEAFGFGLVHGMGFAGSIADTLASAPSKLTALVGFNLGVEAGQLAIVLTLGGLLAWIARARRTALEPAPGWLAPAWIRVSASIVVGALGLYWFAARVGFELIH